MPTILERERAGQGPTRPGRSFNLRERGLRLGLVNNMPDAALARTARQFLDMLDVAAPKLAVRVKFFSLPGIPRSDIGRKHLADNFYCDVSEIASAELDALIITGTEPKAPDLRDEPYWAALAGLLDWIALEGPSTIFSCLAAHAAVLHYDGIERQRLAQKRFGLFDHIATRPHELTARFAPVSKVAHSRWNEVSAEALNASGYQILTQSPQAGVDLFIKQQRNLMLFFQGHPEYEPQMLAREFQRDVRRFLAGEQDHYPDAPEFYFDAAESAVLARFHDRAQAERDVALIAEFPAIAPRPAVDGGWHTPAAGVLHAWLQQIAEAKAETLAAVAPAPRFAGALR